MIVDCAYYERGVRQTSELTLEEAASRPRRGGNYVWIELREPGKQLMAEVGRLFGLHELAVEDAAAAAQDERPKVETYDDFHFIVFRSAAYDDQADEVRFGEVDVFLGAGFVIAVRHAGAEGPERARRLLEHRPELLKTGPAAVVWAILDSVVDDFGPVLDGLEREIDGLEQAIFSRREDLTEQIYLLKRDVNEVYHAIHPLLAPLDALERGFFAPVDPGLLRYFRDVNDHVRRIHEEVLAQRDQLSGVLEAHLSLISLRQNEIAVEQSQVVRRLTLVATVFLPLTFITGFFGQNFGWLVHHIDSLAAFVAFGIGGLVIPCAVFFVWFKRGGLA